MRNRIRRESFNANYLTYFDVAITEYFRFQGHPYGDLASSYGIDFHVVHCSIDYKSPAKFDDEIEIPSFLNSVIEIPLFFGASA
ncbi:hypothetical protein LSS_22815 [Leptospira santarosai serovar Shermani str. LT 821]|uniref:Thioesterase domain-containing protein n=1 Tax=Leptospira santarosai serovar Shermani str. LT 821 TaxID=758847 RepID=A0A097ESX6_9LEPT|nr:hypothetical protein LSS_22815 [Leptospira santarosai serovar Shermani str. LT 821]EPG81551.1 thioesterase family protein [Leptospira santarosai serovar Shermani str. 1342KT]